eukprot:m.7754 g.7754  ORF g.7754 m.7754 type:complete len:1336 (+) comp5285_c0_seq1:130-4137(+)
MLRNSTPYPDKEVLSDDGEEESGTGSDVNSHGLGSSLDDADDDEEDDIVGLFVVDEETPSVAARGGLGGTVSPTTVEDDGEMAQLEEVVQRQSEATTDPDDGVSDQMWRYKIAGLYILDAIAGRGLNGLASVAQHSSSKLRALQVRTSNIYHLLFFAVVVVHMYITVQEQTLTHSYALIGSTLPIVFYLLDIGLQVYARGTAAFKHQWWFVAEMAFTLLFIVDYVLLVTHTRPMPFRLLRPWIFLCKDLELRRFFQALCLTLKDIGSLIFYIFIFVMFFAGIGVHLFQEYYTNLCPTSKEYTFEGAFDNILIATVHMFTLVTTENYPEIMMPIYRRHAGGFIFFCIFFLLGVFYVLPMSLAMVNDVFWRAQRKQVKRDRKQERMALIHAFNHLDTERSGMLSEDQWCDFMAVFRQKLRREAHVTTYRMACAGKPILDWENFLEIPHVLKAKLKERNEGMASVPGWLVPLQRAVAKLMLVPLWSILLNAGIGVYWLMFCMSWPSMNPQITLAVHTVQSVLAFIFVLDLFGRILLYGWNFEHGWQLFGLSINWLETVFIAATALCNVLYWSNVLGFGFVESIGSACQFLRLAYRLTANRTLFQVLEGILDISFKLIMLIFFVTFSYAVLGYEVYFGLSSFDPHYCSTIDPATSCITNTTVGNFDTVECSALMAFQVMTTSNWHELMVEVMEQENGWNALFFISCYVVMQIVLLALMVGTSIEAFFYIRQKDIVDKKNENGKGKAPGKGVDKKGGPSGAAPSVKQRLRKLVTRANRVHQAIQPKGEAKGDTTAAVDVNTPRVVESPASNILAKRRQRDEERRRKRNEKKSGKLPKRCVAIVSEKMHQERDLPIVRGDVIEILDQEEGRYKGKCNGRAGWFSASNVLLVLDEDMISALQKNSDVEYSFQRSHVTQSTDDYLIMHSGVSRRELVQDKITVMAPDELFELHRMAKADLLGSKKAGRRTKTTKRNQVVPAPTTEAPVQPVHPQAPSQTQGSSSAKPTLPSFRKPGRESSTGKTSFTSKDAARLQEMFAMRRISQNDDLPLPATFSSKHQPLQPADEDEEEEQEEDASQQDYDLDSLAKELEEAKRGPSKGRAATPRSGTPRLSEDWSSDDSDAHLPRIVKRDSFKKAKADLESRKASMAQDNWRDTEIELPPQSSPVPERRLSASEALRATPSKSALKQGATPASPSKQVSFAPNTKKRDGSRRQREREREMKLADKEGRLPEWVTRMMQSRPVQVVEGHFEAPTNAGPVSAVPRKSSPDQTEFNLAAALIQQELDLAQPSGDGEQHPSRPTSSSQSTHSIEELSTTESAAPVFDLAAALLQQEQQLSQQDS